MPLAPPARGDALVGAYAGAPTRRRLSRGVWQICRDMRAKLASALPSACSPRFPGVLNACQRWPALPFASVNPLPVNGLAVCQCQRLPAVAPALPVPQFASAGPAGWHRAPGSVASGAACQPPAVASAGPLPVPAVASGRARQWGQLASLPALARSGPQQPRRRSKGGSLLGWPPFWRLLRWQRCQPCPAPTLLPPPLPAL